MAALAAAVYFNPLGGSGQAIDSLAVLPFVNVDGNPDTEYLTDGITGILGLVYEQTGRFDDAIAELQKSMELGGLDNRGNIGHVYAISGKRGEAQKLLDQLQEEARHKAVSPYNIARIYEGLGEKDQTFAWLEKAYKERDSNITLLKVDPQFDSLYSDPRFTDLLRRIGISP